MAANDASSAPPPSQPAGTGRAGATGIQATPPAPAATGVQANPPPPPAATTKAKRPRRPMTLEQLAAWVKRLDTALLVVVLALAFLLASFAVRNSDFWMHLAAGRLLAHGDYHFGTDPFALTTEGVYWANHAWLFDLVLYGLYNLVGGPGLVVIKALLVTLLAWVLLQVRRPDQSPWVPLACTGAALVAMSGRLLLQPLIVSYLFLALTLWVLLTPRPRTLIATRVHPCWLLPPLFFLWVNLDSWFFLGPLAVGLFLLGSLFNKPSRAAASEEGWDRDARRTLVRAWLVGLLACLVNPHHVHAFLSLPPEISPEVARDVLSQDDRLRRLFLSPWEVKEFVEGSGWGVALFSVLLVLAGPASFAVNYGRMRPERVLLWLGAFLLGSYSVRCLAFFAVVAGPITALNFQDFVARRLGTALRLDERWRQWHLGGRVLTLVAGLALLVAAWPGWLYDFRGERGTNRRVAWAVVPDYSYQRAAEKLREWRRDRKLAPTDRGLILLPDLANYCAWYCPEEKGFLDYRLHLFTEVAPTFIKLNEGFLPPPESESEPPPGDRAAPPRRRPEDQPVPGDALQVLRERKISYVVLSGFNQEKMRPGLVRLWRQPDEWPLLYLDGRTNVFGWNDPRRKEGDRFQHLRLNFERLALGPDAVRAPEQGPGRGPEPPDPWRLYVKAPAPRPLECDEVAAYVDLYQLSRQRWVVQNLKDGNAAFWVGFLAQELGAADNPWAHLQMPFFQLHHQAGQFYQLIFRDPLMSRRFEEPLSTALLAVRAARRAVVLNPDHVACYLRARDAIAALSDLQGVRRDWAYRLPFLALTRQVQMAAVCQSALKLQGDSFEAHLHLAQLFQDRGHLDTALKHWKGARDSFRDNPQRKDLDKDVRREFDREVERLEKQVAQQQDEFLRETYHVTNVRLKALRALSLGLSDEALKLLRATDLASMSNDPAQEDEMFQQIDLQVQLLLEQGQLEDAAEGLVPNVKHKLPRYHWQSVLLAAASGDYRRADEHLEDLADLERERAGRLAAGTVGTYLLQQPALDVGPVGAGVYSLVERQGTLRRGAQESANSLRQRANLMVLRGLLALEWGDTARAARHFEQALALCDPGRRDLAALASLGTVLSGHPAVPFAAGLENFFEPPYDFDGSTIAAHCLEMMRSAAGPRR